MALTDLINMGSMPTDPILGGNSTMSPELLNQPLLPQTVQPGANGSMLPKPTISDMMLTAGLALMTGGGISQVALNMNELQKRTRLEAREERESQLKEYELLGRIRERQLAEMQALQKSETKARLKKSNPELADLIDLDESEAAKAIAGKVGPQKPFDGTGMDAQNANILLTGDPSSDAYLAAYNMMAQPKVQTGPDGSSVTITPDMTAYKLPTRLAQQANPQSVTAIDPTAQTAQPSPSSQYAPAGGITYGTPTTASVPGTTIAEGARPTNQDAKEVKDVTSAYSAINDLLAKRKKLIEDAVDFSVGSADALNIEQNTKQILLKVKNLEQTGALDQGSVDVIAPALGDPVNRGISDIMHPIATGRESYTKSKGGSALALKQLRSGEDFLKSTLSGQLQARGYKLDKPLKSIFDDEDAPVAETEVVVPPARGMLDDAPEATQYSAENPAQPATQEEFDALPAGTPFLNPADGKVYAK